MNRRSDFGKRKFDTKQMLRLAKDGFSNRSIARTIGCSNSTVTRYFQETKFSNDSYANNRTRFRDKNIKPKPLLCSCGSSGEIYWSKKESRWKRLAMCPSCKNVMSQHGLTRAEYDALIEDGCSIQDCKRQPQGVDHDHLIHPQASHSCLECFRGVLCNHHNTNIISVIDSLRTGGLRAELNYLGIVAVKFETVEPPNVQEVQEAEATDNE